MSSPNVAEDEQALSGVDVEGPSGGRTSDTPRRASATMVDPADYSRGTALPAGRRIGLPAQPARAMPSTGFEPCTRPCATSTLVAELVEPARLC